MRRVDAPVSRRVGAGSKVPLEVRRRTPGTAFPNDLAALGERLARGSQRDDTSSERLGSVRAELARAGGEPVKRFE